MKKISSLSPLSGNYLKTWCFLKYHMQRSYGTNSQSEFEFEDFEPVQEKDVKTYLNQNSMQFREGFTCLVTTCPKYNHTKLKLNEINKLYINTVTGYFVCQKCQNSGSWAQFKTNTDNILSLLEKGKKAPSKCSSVKYESALEITKSEKLFGDAEPIKNINEDKLAEVRSHLGIENLSLDTLNGYRMRFLTTEKGLSLLLPLFDMRDSFVGLKTISLSQYSKDGTPTSRIRTEMVPKFEFASLFGWHLIKPKCKSVILTGSEWDAMAISQTTDSAALALPKGPGFLSQKVLPALEQFSNITVWLDNDVKSWEASNLLAKKLNPSRCSLVRPSERQPSALSALKEGLSIAGIMKSAHPIKHQSITTFKDLKHEVFSTLSENEVASGVKWKRYPQLNKLLKGHRRGELTVFTGPTGSGKTTFISEYSLDLAMQGVNTLWGSFEINNVKLMKTMLTQYSQMNLIENIDKFEECATKFESLPIFFMTFHGQENTKKVIETMSHAIYVHDIQHVIVDNLQFMMGTPAVQRGSMDRFHIQDEIIASFRRFATHMNCHEKDSEDLMMSSIFGSAKATQEADNVLILQDKRLVSPRGKKFIQVAKNRFDGELGVMLLKFDKDSLTFSSGISPRKVVKEENHSDQD